MAKPIDEVNAGTFYDEQSPTSGIQEAIDSLPRRGGRVRIPSGRWHLSRSIWVPSGVSLIGDGPSTELYISAVKVARLARNIRKGGRTLEFRGRVPFRVGQEIGVRDDQRGGWWGTHGIVEKTDGKRVLLSVPFNRALYASDRGTAQSLFPAITAEGKKDLELRDFSIHGPRGYKGKWWDFTYSAIHLVLCQRARVMNVNVFEWPSDGVGVQRGSDVQVTQCQSHDCAGHGFHPGTGLA